MAEENTPGIVPKVFNLIGLAFCAIFTFMGLIYYLRGNIPVTGFISVLVLIALMLLSTYLVIFKTKKRDYKTLVPEYITGGAYGLLALCIFPFMFHFIDVEFNRKNELKKAGIDKLNELRDLKDAYISAKDEKINTFSVDVEATLGNYFLASGPDRVKYKNSLNEMLGAGTVNSFSRYEFSPDSAYKNMLKTEVESAKQAKVRTIEGQYRLGKVELECDDYYKRALPVFRNWRFMEVSYYYYDIDNMYAKVFAEAKRKMPDFDHAASITGSDMEIDNVFKSVAKAPLPSLILVFLLVGVLHLCILAPYFSVKRPAEFIKKHEGPYDKTGAVDISNLGAND
jgi:hypothetical protein